MAGVTETLRRRSRSGPAKPVAAASRAVAWPQRAAAIDIGSNSIHMLVVESEGVDGYRVLAREREMVRLGRSALGRGRLSNRAIRDGLEALLRMTTLARLKGAARVEAVATSAVREAANGAEFVERIHAVTGLEVRVLAGDEEGALVFRAVRHAVDLGRDTTVLVDLGGGSTEWCVARRGQLTSVRSLQLGSIRGATLLPEHPPKAKHLEQLRREIRRALARVRRPAKIGQMIATSGTAICCGLLVDYFAGRERALSVGGLRELRRKDLTSLIDTLRSLTRREISAIPVVGGPRSGSILAGAVLLEELARHAGVERLHLCDRALREGLILELLGTPAGPVHENGGARERQIAALAQRAPAMVAHCEQVARLAVRLFDLTLPVHNLGDREREWLEAAARVHDVGYAIHFQRHHKHSHYLISTSDLDAFDPREIELLANVARYHRGAAPKRRHAAFAALRPWQQETVQRLAALLRIANALDRTHAARVIELHAALDKKQPIVVEVLSAFDVGLELAAARHRADLFEQVFDRKISFRQGLERQRRSRQRPG